MVVIPAGRFEMGSNNGERNEKPVHSVDVRSFALGKYEVTQGQWMALMGGNPSRFANCGEECPVELVSWDDAKSYVKKLNVKVSGSEEGPYRLPSESEWEYACRGGGRHKYCGSDDVGSVAWYEWNSGGKTRRAGTKAPNGYGLHDLSGSVWEWTEDCWHESYSGAPTNGSAWTSGGDCSRRVERGGSWSNNPAWVRSVTRSRDGASRHINLLGFRVARTLP
jgi:formylglycine-generating enzyme required for sulfatase activity